MSPYLLLLAGVSIVTDGIWKLNKALSIDNPLYPFCIVSIVFGIVCIAVAFKEW